MKSWHCAARAAASTSASLASGVQETERDLREAFSKLAAQQGFEMKSGKMRDAEGVGAHGKGGKGEDEKQRGEPPVGATGEQVFENLRHDEQGGGGKDGGSGGDGHRAADLRAHRVDDAPGGRGFGLGHGILPTGCTVREMIAGFVCVGNGKRGERRPESAAGVFIVSPHKNLRRCCALGAVDIWYCGGFYAIKRHLPR